MRRYSEVRRLEDSRRVCKVNIAHKSQVLCVRATLSELVAFMQLLANSTLYYITLYTYTNTYARA
jgi:hypothetical protein